MFRSTLQRQLTVALAVFLAALAFASPAVMAGEIVVPPDDVDLDVVYINCVDDEVDEPGIDGRAIVRVRVQNVAAADIEVLSGGWSVVAEGEELANGTFVTPATIEPGATWEQVVAIPGDTGPAWFTLGIDLKVGDDDAIHLELDPSLGVPGDCPQPPEETTPDPTVPDNPDVVVTRPRFTG